MAKSTEEISSRLRRRLMELVNATNALLYVLDHNFTNDYRTHVKNRVREEIDEAIMAWADTEQLA